MWEHILQSHHNGSTLISNHVGTHPSITSKWLCIDHIGTHPIITSECLCSDHVVKQPTITSQHHCTYIWSCGNISLNHIRMALHWSCGNTSYHHIRISLHLFMIMWEHIPQSHQNGSTLISGHVGTHPTITSEYLCTYIWPCGTNPLTMSKGHNTYI